MGRPDASIRYFEKAMDWAISRREPETLCIVKG